MRTAAVWSGRNEGDIDFCLCHDLPTSTPGEETLAQYRQEHKTPLQIGDIPSSCEVVLGEFWCRDIARHDRRRLATAVWAVLARRML